MLHGVSWPSSDQAAEAQVRIRPERFAIEAVARSLLTFSTCLRADRGGQIRRWIRTIIRAAFIEKAFD